MVVEKQSLAQCLPLSVQMRDHKVVIHRRHALVKGLAEEILAASNPLTGEGGNCSAIGVNECGSDVQ